MIALIIHTFIYVRARPRESDYSDLAPEFFPCHAIPQASL
jgi:hypothetical protein